MPIGRMPAHLLIWGNAGFRGMLTVAEGMVQRNELAIRKGIVPPFDVSAVRYHPMPVLRDAPVALEDGVGNALTLACWEAADRRVRKGLPATVGMVRGVPMVLMGEAVAGGSRIDPQSGRILVGGGALYGADPSLARGRRADQPVAITGLTTGREDEVWSDWLILGLSDDDDHGEPISAVNTAIARHNARIIRERNLPHLYESNIRYYIEGVPERWLDAQQMAIEGRDDCEGLAAYRAGELINQGYDARVCCRRIDNLHDADRAQMGAPRKKGGRTFHAITGVFGRYGRVFPKPVYDDPSARMRVSMPVPSYYLDFAKKRRAEGRGLDALE